MFEKAPNCMAGEKVGIKSNINEDDDKMSEASASMKDDCLSEYYLMILSKGSCFILLCLDYSVFHLHDL
jgi:hypothetical protein